jgi:hypothetical protein
MTLYGSLIVYSTDNFSEHCCQQEHLYPHKYQWQHFLWRHFETENLEDVNILCRFLFTVNRNEDIVRESFSFKLFYVLRDHLSSNLFMIFFKVIFLTTIVFPLNSIRQ